MKHYLIAFFTALLMIFMSSCTKNSKPVILVTDKTESAAADEDKNDEDYNQTAETLLTEINLGSSQMTVGTIITASEERSGSISSQNTENQQIFSTITFAPDTNEIALDITPENDGSEDELNDTFKKMLPLTYQYFRNTLDEEEQAVYDMMLKFYSNPEKYYIIKNPYPVNSGNNSDIDAISKQIELLIKYIWADNFFISQNLSNTLYFGYSKENNEILFLKKDKMTDASKAIYNNYQDYLDRLEISADKAQIILDNMPLYHTTQRDIALYLHDYLINNTTANTFGATYLNDEAYGVLVEKTATCEGFTNAYTLLCSLKGIKSFGVFYPAEKGKSDGHIWNAVKIDNKFTYIDVFHDNAVFSDGREDIKHTYFGMSGEQLDSKLAISDKNEIDSSILPLLPKFITISTQ